MFWTGTSFGAGCRNALAACRRNLMKFFADFLQPPRDLSYPASDQLCGCASKSGGLNMRKSNEQAPAGSGFSQTNCQSQKKTCKEPAVFSTDSVKRQFVRPNRPKNRKNSCLIRQPGPSCVGLRSDFSTI